MTYMAGGARSVGAVVKNLVEKDRQIGKIHAGTVTLKGGEGDFFTPIPRGAKRVLMRRIEQDEQKACQANRAAKNRRKIGIVGETGILVFRQLVYRVHQATGQLDPSIKTIAQAIGRSVSAVAAALQRLREAGWLTWLRRYVPADATGAKGPQVKQTSNAYRINLDRLPEATPISADLAEWAGAQAGARASMLERLSPGERITAEVKDPRLQALLLGMTQNLA